MTKTDLIKLEEALVMVKEMGIVKPRAKVGIHSPWIEQYFAMKKAFGDVVEVMTKDVWDIEDRKLTMAYDLLVFCNVFMYIDRPAVAFANVLDSCKLLLIQDIIKRDRGANIFGSDGDCMRYEYREWDETESNYTKSNYAKAFDIGKAGEVVRFVPYVDEGVNVHFWAVMTRFKV